MTRPTDSNGSVCLRSAPAHPAAILSRRRRLAGALPNASVAGAPIAGWFFPGRAADNLPDLPWAPPSDWPHWSLGTRGGPFRNGSLVELFQAYLPPACAAAQPAGAAWRCQSVSATLCVPICRVARRAGLTPRHAPLPQPPAGLSRGYSRGLRGSGW